MSTQRVNNIVLKNQAIFGILVVFLFYTLFSCVDPVAGCLDTRSSNFEIDADVDCCRIEEECCCEYPNMTVNFFYKLTAEDSLSSTSTNFRLGQYYQMVGSTDSIRIDTLSFFMSNVHPTNTRLEEQVNVIESILTSGTSAQGFIVEESYEDNIALIDFEQFRYTLGTYQSDLTYDEVFFTLGLSEELSGINPEEVLDDHPLTDDYIFLFDESINRYQSVRLVFNIKTVDNQRDIAQSFIVDTPISTPLLVPVEIDKGNELGIIMRINVLDLFKGIIFDSSTEEIPSIVNGNLIESVSILE